METQDNKQQQQGIVEVVSEKIWKFFSSVKLAVVLLIVLAVVSVIGTVIQQNQPPEDYLREYSMATVQLFEALGFFDLYHTWWFVLLLLLFTANLTICTLERLPNVLKAIKAPLRALEEDGFKALPFRKDLAVKTGGADAVEAAASKALAGKRYRLLVTKEQGVTSIAGQKGAFTRLGYIITHISIILIFVGALIGAFFGYKGFLNLPEGEASQVVYLRNEPLWDKIMAGLGVAKSSVVHDPRGGVPYMPLGFFLRLDDFEVDYYTKAGRPTGMPSEFWSLLSVYSEGRSDAKVMDKKIVVNDPLTYRGVTFYQSSYGTIPNAEGTVILTIRPKGGQGRGETVSLKPGESRFVASIDRTIRVAGFAPFGARNPQTGQVELYRSQNNELVNPTVDLEIYRGKQLAYRTQLLKVDIAEPHMPENYVIGYYDFWGARYTGLQVNKDPGVWIVYTGFILICFGPLVAFFGSHRKVWVRITDRKGQSAVTVGGSANRNRLAFEREFNAIVADLSR